MADDTGNVSRRALGLAAAAQYKLLYFARKHHLSVPRAREILRQAGQDRLLANKLATAERHRVRSMVREDKIVKKPDEKAKAKLKSPPPDKAAGSIRLARTDD